MSTTTETTYTLRGDTVFFFGALTAVVEKSLAAKLQRATEDNDDEAEVSLTPSEVSEVIKSLTWDMEKHEDAARKLRAMLAEVREQVHEQE
jgi:hypothetical protein